MKTITRLNKVTCRGNIVEGYHFAYGKEHMIDEEDLVAMWNEVPADVRGGIVQFLSGVKVTDTTANFVPSPFPSYGDGFMEIEGHAIEMREFKDIWNRVPADVRRAVMEKNSDKIYNAMTLARDD